MIIICYLFTQVTVNKYITYYYCIVQLVINIQLSNRNRSQVLSNIKLRNLREAERSSGLSRQETLFSYFSSIFYRLPNSVLVSKSQDKTTQESRDIDFDSLTN